MQPMGASREWYNVDGIVYMLVAGSFAILSFGRCCSLGGNLYVNPSALNSGEMFTTWISKPTGLYAMTY